MDGQATEVDTGFHNTAEGRIASILEQVSKNGFSVERIDSSKQLPLPEGFQSKHLDGKTMESVFSQNNDWESDVVIWNPRKGEVKEVSINVSGGVKPEDEVGTKKLLEEGWKPIDQRRDLQGLYEHRYFYKDSSPEEQTT